MNTENPHHHSDDVLVIGAGATGLSAAYHLTRAGKTVRLIEAADRIGGNIGTLAFDDWQVETGPNSLMLSTALATLIDDLGLHESLQVASDTASKRFVVKNGRPVALPTNPLTFLTSPLFGLGDLFHLMREPWIRRADHEETIAEFVRRRLGQGFLDWAIDPFVSGVYAGDPNRLSVRAATPKIYALERDQGSLIRGALAKMKARKAERAARESENTPDDASSEDTPAIQTMPAGKLISFRHGLGELVEALAQAIEDGSENSGHGTIHTGERVTTIVPPADDALWRVTTHSGQTFTARQLVLATPAWVSADLLTGLSPDLAETLNTVPYPAVASVALGFARKQVRHPLDGFGMLIPSKEQHQTLGVLFSSSLFPGRAEENQVLLTAFIGGRRHPEAAEGKPEEIIERVLADLRPLLGIEGEPLFQRVQSWPRAIPQYERGHLERIEVVDRLLADLPGLSLAGNWRDGIAVGDCLENGRKLAERLTGTESNP